MTCPYCKSTMAPDAKVCWQCGAHETAKGPHWIPAYRATERIADSVHTIAFVLGAAFLIWIGAILLYFLVVISHASASSKFVPVS